MYLLVVAFLLFHLQAIINSPFAVVHFLNACHLLPFLSALHVPRSILIAVHALDEYHFNFSQTSLVFIVVTCALLFPVFLSTVRKAFENVPPQLLYHISNFKIKNRLIHQVKP